MIPPNPTLITISGWLLLGAFAAYLIASLLYISGFIGSRISQGEKFHRNAQLATGAHLVGTCFQAAAILARWQGAGHWPTSNMYEFIGFMAFACMVAFQVINRIYSLPVLGALVAPIGVLLMAYSYVFPPKVAPLIAPLKSYWLPLHVSMAAFGEGFFAVAFGAAVLYLLRARGLELSADHSADGRAAALSNPGGVWGRRALEGLFYTILVLAGFTMLALALRYSGVQWVLGNATYHLPPIIGPAGAELGSQGSLLGIPLPAMIAPMGWKGRNLNTLLYSLIVGGLLYWTIRVIVRGPISDFLAQRISGDLELLDEISYRAVAFGYPIFTLGALVFAMFWAKEAWGRYWFWDPKETWAFIAWAVYSVYLHMRITRGWAGQKSAWMAVIGFGVVLFTLVGVNLLIVGMHSYAGGDA